MKNQQRLMKIVEIQDNYQKHRKRLMSIQHIDSRKKQFISSLAPPPAATAYKQSKLKAELFNYKTRNSQIQHQNQILMKHIEREHFGRNNERKLEEKLTRSPSSQSVRSSRSMKVVKTENSRLLEKIGNTKSIYSKLRTQNNKKDSKSTSKEEIMHLLVNQLGVKPTVLFPTLSSKSRPSKSVHHRSRQQNTPKFHFNNAESIKPRKASTKQVSIHK